MSGGCLPSSAARTPGAPSGRRCRRCGPRKRRRPLSAAQRPQRRPPPQRTSYPAPALHVGTDAGPGPGRAQCPRSLVPATAAGRARPEWSRDRRHRTGSAPQTAPALPARRPRDHDRRSAPQPAAPPLKRWRTRACTHARDPVLAAAAVVVREQPEPSGQGGQD